MRTVFAKLILPLPAFIIFLLSSCKYEPLRTGDDSTSAKEIALDSFSEFPPEIDGCACYFSDSEEEFKKSTYIYTDDYGKNAFVSINGVMTKFELIASDTSIGSARPSSPRSSD